MDERKEVLPVNNLEWAKDVTMEMLPEAHRKFAEVIGVEATVKLCATWGGGTPYIPIADTLYTVVRDGMIRREFARGISVPHLARRYDLTERTVQRIVQDIRPEQITLLDDGIPT